MKMFFAKQVKRLLAGVLASALVLGTTACQSGGNSSSTAASSGNGSSASKAPVTVKFLYIWPENQDIMNESIQMIEKQHPDIKVEASTVTWDKITSQLQTDIAAGDAPDVSFMWPDLGLSSFVSLNAALDLTPYLDKDSQWKDSFMSSNVLQSGTINGKTYGIPFRGSAKYICYNKGLFQKNGWSAPNTIEDLQTLMKTMKSKGIQPFSIAGKPDGFEVFYLVNCLYDENIFNAGIMSDKQYALRRKTDITTPYADAFQTARDWYNSGYFGSSPLSLSREEAQTSFFNGKSAMLICNNNELTDVRKLAGSKIQLGFTPIPQYAKTKEKCLWLTIFDGFFVYSKTKHPDQAVELLKGLTSKDVQQLWADKTLSAAVVKDINYKDSDLKTMAGNMQNAGKYDQQPDYNVGDLDTKNQQAFVNFLLSKSVTPQQLAQTFNDNTKKAIEDSSD